MLIQSMIECHHCDFSTLFYEHLNELFHEFGSKTKYDKSRGLDKRE